MSFFGRKIGVVVAAVGGALFFFAAGSLYAASNGQSCDDILVQSAEEKLPGFKSLVKQINFNFKSAESSRVELYQMASDLDRPYPLQLHQAIKNYESEAAKAALSLSRFNTTKGGLYREALEHLASRLPEPAAAVASDILVFKFGDLKFHPLYRDHASDITLFKKDGGLHPIEFDKARSGTVLLFGKLFGQAVLKIVPAKTSFLWKKIASVESETAWKQAGFDYIPIEPIIEYSKMVSEFHLDPAEEKLLKETENKIMEKPLMPELTRAEAAAKDSVATILEGLGIELSQDWHAPGHATNLEAYYHAEVTNALHLIGVEMPAVDVRGSEYQESLEAVYTKVLDGPSLATYLTIINPSAREELNRQRDQILSVLEEKFNIRSGSLHDGNFVVVRDQGRLRLYAVNLDKIEIHNQSH